MQPVIFFDGICNLCNGAVQFTIRRDPDAVFKFAALQGDFAAGTLLPLGIEPSKGASIVLLENGKIYERSTAALRIARRLGGWWPLLYGFIVVPAFIRDAFYNFIARNRYKWYGKQESCWIPTPELKERFIS